MTWESPPRVPGSRVRQRTSMCAGSRSECSYRRKPTFSPTVSESKRAPLWNTIPMCRLEAVAGSSSDSSPFLAFPCGEMVFLHFVLATAMFQFPLDCWDAASTLHEPSVTGV